MPPIPDRFKRAILPFWNVGHRLAWRLGEYLNAIRHRRFERCACCGRWGPMLYRRWVIRPELERRLSISANLAEALARKESSDCWACGAKLRARRIAEVILQLYPTGAPTAPSPSIRDWVRTSEARALAVAEVNEIEGMHRQLVRLPKLHYSEYRDDACPGDVIDGIRSEHLDHLTYPDASFDLLVSSETLEHVPELLAALRETRRVLRPGGRHVFTVPLLPGVPKTYARAVRRPDGTIEHHHTPISHPGGDWGYPVFTEFGADLPGLLRDAGFEVDLAFGPVRDDDVSQVFIGRKPVDPP